MCAASVACTLLLLLTDALSFAVLGLSLTPLVAGIVLLTLTREAPYLFYRPATLPPANREDDAAPELAFDRAGVLPSVTEHTTRSLGGAAPARSPQPARPIDTRPR